MSLSHEIVISGIASVSGLGASELEISTSLQRGDPCMRACEFSGGLVSVSPLSDLAEDELSQLLEAQPMLQDLDRSVHLAILASRKAFQSAGLIRRNITASVNIGSSRGATGLFERLHLDFLKSGSKDTPVHTSPSTTLGNISSWVAQDLRQQGMEIEHSVTCSTGLQAVLNGIAWLGSGLTSCFVAGASEAPLTPFTVAQMRALRIYSTLTPAQFPCRPLAEHPRGCADGLVLGEGSAVAVLERAETLRARGGRPLAKISGFGFAREEVTSATSISAEGTALQSAMRMALGTKKSVDVIIPHCPGTRAGDEAEFQALRAVFGENLPSLCSVKWMVGHTFAAAGSIALHLAIKMISGDRLPTSPYALRSDLKVKECGPEVRSILINAAGFGGNAISLLIESCD